VPIHESLTLKLKRKGRGKPVVKEFQGDDEMKSEKRWMKKTQIVDRENDRYRKLIVDPLTGAVIRDVDKPLSQHRGHGSAKGRPKS